MSAVGWRSGRPAPLVGRSTTIAAAISNRKYRFPSGQGRVELVQVSIPAEAQEKGHSARRQEPWSRRDRKSEHVTLMQI
jgi:hypothetical protein